MSFDEEEDEGSNVGMISFVLIFSFISIILLFVSLIIIGGVNNYALYDLLSISNSLISDDVVHSSFSGVIDDTASSFLDIVPYLDKLWFISFIALIFSSLTISYMRNRENYFSILTMSTLGLVVIMYIGGIFIQLTDWFRDEILLRVFPTFSTLTPLFSWYLDHIGIVNLVLLASMIIVNYVDLDFSKFNSQKDKEDINEI